METSTLFVIAGFLLACAALLVRIFSHQDLPPLGHVFAVCAGISLVIGFLRRDKKIVPIKPERVVKIKALHSGKSLSKLHIIFSASVDMDLSDLSRPGRSTPEMEVEISKRKISEGSYANIFMSLPGALKDRLLTRWQVAEFCENFPDWLKQDNFCTKMFFCQEDESRPITREDLNDNLNVFLVDSDAEGLIIFKDKVSFEGNECSIYDYRVIAPHKHVSV